MYHIDIQLIINEKFSPEIWKFEGIFALNVLEFLKLPPSALSDESLVTYFLGELIKNAIFAFHSGAFAERLGAGLQNLLQRFDSARHLPKKEGYKRPSFFVSHKSCGYCGTHGLLLHIQEQSLQVLPFRVVDAHGMIARLVEAIQNADTTPTLGRSRKKSQGKLLLIHCL